MSYPFGQCEPNFDTEFEETAFLYRRQGASTPDVQWGQSCGR